MRKFLALLGFCALLFAGRAFAETKSFTDEQLQSDGIRLEEQIKKDGAASPARPLEQLRRDAQAALARSDFDGAMTASAAGLAANPKDAGLWFVYARAASGSDGKNYQRQSAATTAAYLAYQLATTKNDEAAALALLGNVYASRAMWRPSLDALRLSLELADNAAIRARYEDERAKYGFRILDYKVDSDSASPRVCFQFSESLARGRVDFAPYVAVAGAANGAISVEDQQLCVEGLKHGEHYAIVLRQGLPSAVKESLLKSADYDIYVRDRSAQVHFTGKNYVLPRVGQEGIPVVSVNTPKIGIDILRIGDRNLLPTLRSEDFLSQLSSYRIKKYIDNDGVKIWSGSLTVASALNQDVTTAFPVLEAVGKLEPGVYVMIAKAGGAADAGSSDDDDGGTQATQWFIVSDLGLTAFSGNDGVHVFVRSLASAQPQTGISLRLVARDNEVLATKTTGADGHVRFDPGLARGKGGLAPGLVVAEDGKGDYGFLDLTQAPFDLTDRGVKGRAAVTALDALVFTERGVYRSGETVFVTALLRDGKGNAVVGLPLTLVVQRPDGVEYKRVQTEDQGDGGRSLTLPLLSDVATGTWRIQAFADPKSPPIGETSFLIEDYVPERLEFTLTPQATSARAGESVEIAAAARYLYGAPGADLDISGGVEISSADDAGLAALKGYVAGLQDEAFDKVSKDLEEVVTTDEKGEATLSVPIPEAAAQRPLQAKITLRAGETGGRAVERSVTLPLLPKGGLIGVKNNFASLGDGDQATFDVIAVGTEGTRVARKGVAWSLYRLSTTYQWYNQDGRWGFEKVKSSRRVADGKIDLAIDAPARIAAQVGLGTYRLDLTSDTGTDLPTSITFESGWGGEASAETPDLLDVAIDKTSYMPGEPMHLRIASRFAGTATIAIIGENVDAITLLDIKAGDNSVALPVNADWGSAAYAVVLAHRPLDAAAKRMPGRALGLAWFSIGAAARKIDVALNLPEKLRPRGPLTVPIELKGFAPGEEARVTLAAVDVGILSLTRYAAPDPHAYFFGQRQLPIEIRDLYGLLIDGMQGMRGAIRSGGDAGAALAGNKPTQEPLARYSGIVKVGADGKAQVTFDLPAFNGTVRLMATAWSKTKLGSASADLVVRDPVVMAATLPRFLALGDRSQLHLQFDNVEGSPGDYILDLDLHGPLSAAADALHKTFKLDKGARTLMNVPLTAAGLGTATIDVKLTGPGLDAPQSFALTIEPGTSNLYRRSVRMLAPGASLTLSQDLLADYLPGTGAAALAVSPVAGIDVPALLQALDRYPYGCSEQIVSRAMPLLYVNKLASGFALGRDVNSDERVRGAIERLLTRQDSNGAFGLWSAADPDDMWLHAYVTDFLTRARENNFIVPQKAFNLALERLRNHVVNAGETAANQSASIAYAAYVLARNGRPVMGDLRYLSDTQIETFDSPLARAQIGAALALLGDRGRAAQAFAKAADRLQAMRDTLYSRADYGSRLRDGAGLMALAAETGIAHAEIGRASLVVESARAASSYTSTQEDNWMVLAAEALAKEAETTTLSVDGVPQKGAYYRTFTADALEGRTITITNTGQAPASLVVTTSGNPYVPEPEKEQGYRIERAYYALDGTKLDPATPIKQNDRIVVTLKVTETEAAYARLLLVDPLPAGLEIDNPDLYDGGSVEGLSWLTKDVAPTHAEYRDDRFVAAFDRDGKNKAIFTAAYIVRAVTPGHYVLPPASIEDMYRPQRFGRTAFGSLDITASK